MVKNIDEIAYYFIKKSLDASSVRSRVIAHNLSNVNKKGYKAYRVVFEDKLKDVVNNQSTSLKVTNEKHINNGDTLDTIDHMVVRDTSTSMRLDGNNVDIDKEATELAANAILYNALVSQANSRISMRRFVISEGRR